MTIIRAYPRLAHTNPVLLLSEKLGGGLAGSRGQDLTYSDDFSLSRGLVAFNRSEERRVGKECPV